MTITYLQFVHGRCSDKECPVCRWWTPKDGPSAKSMAWNKKRVTSWLKEKGITVLPDRRNDSPFWNVTNSKEECYAKLRAK